MNENCFDSGIIQAFLDGELAPEMSVKFTNHIAVCDECAIALADAEEESAFVFAALGNELDTLVPTQRLWTKINESIAEEKKQTPFLQKVWSFITVSLATPSFAAVLGFFVVAGIFTAVLTMRQDTQETTIAGVNQPKIATPVNDKKVITDEVVPVSNPSGDEVVQPLKATEKRTNSRENDFRKLVVKASYSDKKREETPKIEPPAPQPEKAVYLPGEASYVKTIATLNQTVAAQKDTVLRPSARVAFEKDLAVVEDSIDKMKKEVRKNPKNETAKQVLYAAYQNKIDLLNSVAERGELMASLK
ncbi:MAG TPA: zf-HC2 domain-containing protein [Pyrinomonadaceae bacterium]|nr:zf-HC2 domain-containing protein [Pyrinomonadaceae bacterium]